MKGKAKTTILLLIGLILLYFSNGRATIGIVAFIAPIFLILAGRRMKLFKLYLIFSIGMGIVFLFAFWKFSSINVQEPLFYIPFFLGFLMSIPYVMDAFFHQKKRGILASLAFPCTYVVVEFFYVTLSPFGSTGSIAYSQDEFLVLLQLLSITGIYGITFMVSWFGSTVATMIEDHFGSEDRLIILLPYTLVFIVVILFGAIRLGMTTNYETVKVSGISVYDLRSPDTKKIWRQWDKQTETFCTFRDEMYNRLEEVTHEEAQKGAKVVVWSELSPWLSPEMVESNKQRLATLAKENQIYLVAAPYVFPKEADQLGLNEALLFGPDGTLLMTHIKFGGAMMDGIVEGDKKLQMVETPYGNMGIAICWDADFPAIIRQAGKLDVDMLFSPAADWKEITPLHSRNLYYRSIENGMNIIRVTASGQSLVSDTKGRIIAQTNSFDKPNASCWVIRGEMPTKGCYTLYTQVGDLFAYLCILGLIGLLRWRIIENEDYNID